MIDLVDMRFVEKCWDDLTKSRAKSAEVPMGENNQRLFYEFIHYGPAQQSVAKYVFMVHSHMASKDRADEDETKWRVGVAISLFLSAMVFLFELQRLAHNEMILGLTAAIGAFGGVVAGVYVLLQHRIAK